MVPAFALRTRKSRVSCAAGRPGRGKHTALFAHPYPCPTSAAQALRSSLLQALVRLARGSCLHLIARARLCPTPTTQGLEAPLLQALVRCDWPRPPPDRPAAAGVGGHAPGSPFLAPRRLIYLSCGYPALVRDTCALLGLRPVGGGPPGGCLGAAGGPGGGGSGQEQGQAGRGGSRSSKRRRRRRRRSESGVAQEGGEDVAVADAGKGGESVLGPGLQLGTAKWRLVEAQAFLFFPGTDSIETLAVFEEVVH